MNFDVNQVEIVAKERFAFNIEGRDVSGVELVFDETTQNKFGFKTTRYTARAYGAVAAQMNNVFPGMRVDIVGTVTSKPKVLADGRTFHPNNLNIKGVNVAHAHPEQYAQQHQPSAPPPPPPTPPADPQIPFGGGSKPF